VCYNESVYRVTDGGGQFREITQTGIECIGDIDLYDIYETVRLAAESLAMIGADFVLQISDLGVLSAVLDSVCDRPGFRQRAANLIARKNAHDLARLCREYGVSASGAEKLGRLVSVYGQRQKVLLALEELLGENAACLQELDRLSGMLEKTPYSQRIVFDFSLVNDMNYYCGIVFRGYISGISGGILSGGRYDGLMAKMGHNAGAVGFALYLDLLEQLRVKQDSYDVDVLLLYDAGVSPEALAEQIRLIRESGRSVSAQRGMPGKLRYRECVDMRKDAEQC
jgi:ATP phosphoribosyltransferase regulatory subunit